MSINQQDEFGNTSLFNASNQCDLILVRELLKDGANPNIQNYDSDAPIHMAILQICPDVVLELLKGGANPNVLNYDGYSPIQLAIYSILPSYSGAQRDTLVQIVKYLVNYKADTNLIDPQGFCPIHIAILRGIIELVKILLDGGGNPNIEDKEGNNPLVFSVYQNNKDIVALLIQYGSLNIEGNFAKTPLDYAIFFGFANIAQLLKNLRVCTVRVKPNMQNCNFPKKIAGRSLSYILN